MLGEGRWRCTIDEKDRLYLPVDIREDFGEGIWAIEQPERIIVLYTLDGWEERLKRAKNRQQFRLLWRPMTRKQDSSGRISIPSHIKEFGKLGRRVTLVSMDNYLKILSENGSHPINSNNPGSTTLEITKPFQNGEEAEEYLRKGKEVIYLGYGGRKVEGKLKSGDGTFFSFSGKDERGIIVSIKAAYWEFYPINS